MERDRDLSGNGRETRDPDERGQAGNGSEMRDRDEFGRARNARPRDGLGRPLPRGAAGVPTMPDDLGVTPAEALEQAQRLLDADRPFHAHEVLEAAWKAAPEPERELWRGLAQIAVGVTHARRGNPTGAARLLGRAAERLRAYAADPPHGIDIAGLVRFCATGEGTPRLRLGESAHPAG
ncbi:DUF309 domain-containing protein [Dactylosporangium sp. NPDC005572]|uniref:DUF309 domain-containing protein n=1 Tax=Dactylosporangium sp. NPDC005572 TaxID=3156889 RepID=UPI0033B4783C